MAAFTASCGVVGPSAAQPCIPNSPLACTEIDGYPVGRLSADCGSDGVPCGDAGLLGLKALDARDPDHPAPIQVQQFDVDLGRLCGPTLCAFTSSHRIVVFTFADGSHRATGYECMGVGSCVGTLRWNEYSSAVTK